MKNALSIIALLIISSFVNAQNFYGGILGGFNSTQLDGDALHGYHKMGLISGLWIQTDANEQQFWGAELKYSEKGSRKNPTRVNPDKFIYRANYVDLPVYGGFKYNSAVSFVYGFSFNYLANANASSFLVTDIEGFRHLIDNWELAALVGAKINFENIIQQSWAKKFILDLRFNYSLLSIYDSSNPNVFNRRGLYNNVVSTALYYRIDLGGRND